jgi:hypothetical protein
VRQPHTYNWNGSARSFETKSGEMKFNRGNQVRTDLGNGGSIYVEVGNNDDGSSPSGVMVCEYTYDQYGNRIEGTWTYIPGGKLPNANNNPDHNPRISTFDNKSTVDIKVYPNPSNGVFNIENLDEECKPLSFEIYNTLGNCIYKSNSSSNFGNTQSFDISDQIGGNYFLKINFEEYSTELRIIKH